MHWVVRYSPKAWDARAGLAGSSVGDRVRIPVNQQTIDERRFRVGRGVVVWAEDDDPGVIALVRIEARPEPTADPISDRLVAWSEVTIEGLGDPTLCATDLESDPALSNLSVLRKRHGFCTRVTTEEWKALKQKLK